MPAREPVLNSEKPQIQMPKIKDKERILKAARENETVTCKGMPIRLSADFSKETVKESRGWKEVFKVMKN